ncbi:PQQ-binding-like beta-propeller repeat protein [Streptomyces sp. NPDC000983]|uniref:outer membrane protein assembly factor BamB family protein n=1 Tax=Streptomyces sp. NPDC000983 TaxID=3154373 RepID=UPI00332343F0
MHEDSAPDSVWLPRRRLRRALRPVWEARHDGPAEADALGTWLHGGLVVRAAYDRLRAFDIATGEERWAWEVPGRDVLSAVCPEVVGGVGLLAHWPDTSGGREEATVTALDMASGGELWSARHNLDALWIGGSGLQPGILGLSGERAMIATGKGVVALDARTGRRVWQVSYALDGEARIAAGGGRLVLVTRKAGQARVRSVDVADGTVQWDRRLPPDSPVDRVAILAVDPTLIVVEGEGRRSPDCLLRLDAQGDVAMEMPLAGGHGTITTEPYGRADGRRWIALAGDTLLAFVVPPGLAPLTRLAGFSLSTGQHRWTWGDDGGGIDALACRRGHVVALRHFEEVYQGEHLAWRCLARVLDVTYGREVAHRRLRVTRDEPYALHVHGDRLLWVNKESGPGTPPVKAFDWR